MRTWGFIIILIISMFDVVAQDILYTKTGNKIKAKVLEINTTDIKYKDFLNVEGPVYVISLQDVVLIEFENKTTQIITSNPNEVNPIKQEAPVQKGIEKKKLPNLYYFSNNLLSVNALALANGDFTLIYDREILDNKVILSFLGGYNFNTRMGLLNAIVADPLTHAKKNYDAGLGLYYMTNTTKRAQYYIGVMLKYMNYTYDKEISTGNNQFIYQKESGYQFNTMFSNGLQFRITPSFNLKFFGCIGTSSGIPSIYQDGIPKIYLGYCFGYRF